MGGGHAGLLRGEQRDGAAWRVRQRSRGGLRYGSAPSPWVTWAGPTESEDGRHGGPRGGGHLGRAGRGEGVVGGVCRAAALSAAQPRLEVEAGQVRRREDETRASDRPRLCRLRTLSVTPLLWVWGLDAGPWEAGPPRSGTMTTQVHPQPPLAEQPGGSGILARACEDLGDGQAPALPSEAVPQAEARSAPTRGSRDPPQLHRQRRPR